MWFDPPVFSLLWRFFLGCSCCMHRELIFYVGLDQRVQCTENPGLLWSIITSLTFGTDILETRQEAEFIWKFENYEVIYFAYIVREKMQTNTCIVCRHRRYCVRDWLKNVWHGDWGGAEEVGEVASARVLVPGGNTASPKISDDQWTQKCAW